MKSREFARIWLHLEAVMKVYGKAAKPCLKNGCGACKFNSPSGCYFENTRAVIGRIERYAPALGRVNPAAKLEQATLFD